MKTHNTRIKEEYIINYLEKSLEDCPEKKFVLSKMRDSFEEPDYDIDFEEWVHLPEGSYLICDKCKKEVQIYWHKHTAYTPIINEPLYMMPPAWTETCLCKHCYNEMMKEFV